MVALTGEVATLKGIELFPSAIVSWEGTTDSNLLLARDTAAPPAGAGRRISNQPGFESATRSSGGGDPDRELWSWPQEVGAGGYRICLPGGNQPV